MSPWTSVSWGFQARVDHVTFMCCCGMLCCKQSSHYHLNQSGLAVASDSQDGASLWSFVEDEGGEIPATPHIFLLAVNNSDPAVHGSRDSGGNTICRVCKGK